MQSSIQSVGLKNGFFFSGQRIFHRISGSASLQVIKHLGVSWIHVEIRLRSTEAESGGDPGAWGLKTSWILVDETSCGKNGESHHLKIASDIKISQDTTVGETSHVS